MFSNDMHTGTCHNSEMSTEQYHTLPGRQQALWQSRLQFTTAFWHVKWHYIIMYSVDGRSRDWSDSVKKGPPPLPKNNGSPKVFDVSGSLRQKTSWCQLHMSCLSYVTQLPCQKHLNPEQLSDFSVCSKTCTWKLIHSIHIVSCKLGCYVSKTYNIFSSCFSRTCKRRWLSRF